MTGTTIISNETTRTAQYIGAFLLTQIGFYSLDYPHSCPKKGTILLLFPTGVDETLPLLYFLSCIHVHFKATLTSP
jgi:hypothetical protein